VVGHSVARGSEETNLGEVGAGLRVLMGEEGLRGKQEAGQRLVFWRWVREELLPSNGIERRVREEKIRR
jgi:hypothetical protein